MSLRRNYKKVSWILAIVLFVNSAYWGNQVPSSAHTDAGSAVVANNDTNVEKTEKGIASETAVEVTAEDKEINSDFVLSEDLVIGNLSLTKGTLNLNGYSLVVQGNLTQTGGTLDVKEGDLVCHGDYMQSGNSTIKMNSQNGYIKILGDFSCLGREINETISAGTIEFKGDFYQDTQQEKSILGGRFCTTGTSEVIFSGDMSQNIHMNSEYSYFQNLTLKNKSKEGIFADTIINSIYMKRNSTKVTVNVEGEWGYTLTEDEEYDGDFVLIGDTLNLNGHTLHINGDFIQMNGNVNVNGGSLKVSGDYRMQQRYEDGAEYKYCTATTLLNMTHPDDSLRIKGDFIADSSISHSNFLTDGKMFIGGNLVQKKSLAADNFATTDAHRMIFDGQEQQSIQYVDSSTTGSYPANITIENKKGIRFDSDIRVGGEIKDNRNPVEGKPLLLTSATRFADDYFSGNVHVNSSITIKNLEFIGGNLTCTEKTTLSSDLTVKGNLDVGQELHLSGNKLEVRGNVTNNGKLYLENGQMICGADLVIASSGNLVMQQEEDYVLVNGNMSVERLSADDEKNMSAGTLELKGDFTHTAPGRQGNFLAASTHTTIFSGKSQQTVVFSDTLSRFGTVELKNTSENGVYAPNGINCAKLNKNGNKLTTELEGEAGWTLEKDETYNGTLHLVSEELNLNGHTLTVTGDVIQSAGGVNLNGGKLIVEGDYRIQSESVQDGNTIYGDSTGYLHMTDEEDRLIVKGSFITNSTVSSKEKLTAGIMKVAGDVVINGSASRYNFYCSKEHTLVLDGTTQQTISIQNERFENLCLQNLTILNTGQVRFLNTISVNGHVNENDNNVEGTYKISKTTTFENGKCAGSIKSPGLTGVSNLTEIGGDLYVEGSTYLKNNLHIGGNLSLSGYSLGLGGNSCTIDGNVSITGTKLSVNKGQLICGGNLTLAYRSGAGSFLSLENEEDYVCIKGDMTDDSASPANVYLKAGMLELKGDFTQTAHSRVGNISGTCKLILSGDKLQSLSFDSEGCYFTNVEITNDSEKGVYSEDGIHTKTLVTNGARYETSLEGEMGSVLTGDKVYEGDLVLNGGTLDLNGHTLTVKGDLLQQAGVVDIHGGELNVMGDYCIAKKDSQGAWTHLVMTDERDKIFVGGNFLMASHASHSGSLAAGVLKVNGDVMQKTKSSAQNFATTKDFTLVLCGDSRQTVTMDTASKQGSFIHNFTLDNSSEEGVVLEHILVTGNVVARQGKTSGRLAISDTTTFEDNTFNGSIEVTEAISYPRELHIKGDLSNSASFTLKGNITVSGNLYAGAAIALNSNTMEIEGNAEIKNSVIRVSSGKFLCQGNLTTTSEKSETGFEMTSKEGYVLVGGDMYSNVYASPTMSEGTLELRGNFTENPDSNTGFIKQSINGKTIFSGDKLQTVSLSSDQSMFGTVTIKNESKDGVYFKGPAIRALALDINGCRVRCDGNGCFGWTLEEDTVIEDDLYIIGDELNLNGHNLTVNGNLIVGFGSVCINGGMLTVNGDLRLQSMAEDGSYVAGSGNLYMTDENDSVLIMGDFVSETVQNTKGQLTAGVLEIQGDFQQGRQSRNEYGFLASDSHEVIFSGKEEQSLYFFSSSRSYFQNVTFENRSGRVTFQTSVQAKGMVTDDGCVNPSDTNYLILSNLNQLKEGKFDGSINLSGSCTVNKDISIGGKLIVSFALKMDNYTLRVGNLSLSSDLYTQKGKVYAENDVDVRTYGSIIMDEEDSYVFIKGNLNIASSKCKWTAGVLELCGDFNASAQLSISGSHRTILCGKTTAFGRDYVQNITLHNSSSCFNELELKKRQDKYYLFNRDIEKICNKLIIGNNDFEEPEQVKELKVTDVWITRIALSWKKSNDNIGVKGYQIYRGTKLIGDTVETVYTDTGLEPDTAYDYTVYAYDEAGNFSEVSASVAGMTEKDTSAPVRPTGVCISAQTGSSVTISWNRCRDNVKVVNYKIYRDGEYIGETGTNQNSYKDSGLSADTSYQYQVMAVDSSGNESELSAGISGMPKMPQITGISPERQAVIGGTKVALTLYYKNIGNSTGNKVLFQYSADGGETFEDISSVKIGQSEFEKDLLCSSFIWDISKYDSGNYLIRATLYDADNNTDVLETSYTVDKTGIATPEYIEAVDENGVITVSWSESDTANCEGYELYRSCEGEDHVRLAALTERDSTSYTDKKVEMGKTYRYYVVAVGRWDMRSAHSAEAVVTVSEDKQAPVVGNITADRERINKGTSLTVEAKDNIGVTSVWAEYFDGREWVVLQEGEGTSHTFTIQEELPTDGVYKIRGAARDANGNIGIGREIEYKIDTIGVEAADIDSVTSTSNSVSISWKQPKEDDFAYYIVEQKIGETYTKVAREGRTLGVKINKLKKDKTYTFRVVGYDTVGNRGKETEDFTVSTKKDTSAPSIKNFNPVNAYYQNSIPLSISAADDCGLGDLMVSYSTDNKEWVKAAVLSASNQETSFTYTYDLDLSELPEGEIKVRLELWDAAGNQYSKDAVRSFYHDKTAPAALEDIHASGGDGFIEIEWGEPKEEDFESFDLYRQDSGTGEFKCICKNTTALNYYDTDIQVDKNYSYRVVVKDMAGNQSGPSKSVYAKCGEDLQAPVIHGTAPGSDSTIGLNETIRVLVSDNRELSQITMDYRSAGSAGMWTEWYSESMSGTDKIVSAKWENGSLTPGDYEFRITVLDESGNTSDGTIVTYHFDPEYGKEQDTGSSDGKKEEIEENAIAVSLDTTQLQRAGKEYVFDASDTVCEVSPSDTYSWDFGDGSSAQGAKVTHTYETPGEYTATLTVSDKKGNIKSEKVPVTVASRASGGVSVKITSDSGEVLANSYVHIENSAGKEIITANADAAGSFSAALDAGTYTVSVYSTGYLPKEQTIRVTPGTTKKLTFALEKKDVIEGNLTHRKLSLHEIIEMGVDLTDEENWYIHRYAVYTYKNGIPTGDSQKKVLLLREGIVTTVGNASYVLLRGKEDEEVLIEYKTERWLKQMYDVELTLMNQAAEGFTITNSSAKLELPDGLSLAGMKEEYGQQLNVSLSDMPGQTEETIHWCIRGDKPGSYNISAEFAGNLQPFNVPLKATIYDKTPIVITESDEYSDSDTDDGFLEDGGTHREYTVEVEDRAGDPVMGAYVVMSYQGKSTRAVTDSNGIAKLKINEEDDRIFQLSITCDGYKKYTNNKYKANLDDYGDSFVLLSKDETGDKYEDENKDYKGDFTLEYAKMNQVDLANREITIDTSKTKDYSLFLMFSGNASEVEILLKLPNMENISLAKKKVNANQVTLSLSSEDMIDGMDMYVKAIDKKEGKWHRYKLKNVKIVEDDEDEIRAFESYDPDLAEQCAVYSSLAYYGDFLYNEEEDNLVCKQDKDLWKKERKQFGLERKCKEDGYEWDSDYLMKNYGDDDRHNCSYSIVYKRDPKSKSGYIVFVIIRGTDGVEWKGNMEVTGESYNSQEKNHQDFANAADNVYSDLKNFLQHHCFSSTKIIVTGHSRGGAVSNLLAKKIIDNQMILKIKGVVAYTFATPGVTTYDNTQDAKYDSIYNFCLEDDFVPSMPFKEWGYGRYGQTAFANTDHLFSNDDMFKVRRESIWKVHTGKHYDYEGKKKLVDHVLKYWHGIEDYYNTEYRFFIANRSLYYVMHEYVAEAIVNGISDGSKIAGESFSFGSKYRRVCWFFFKGGANFEFGKLRGFYSLFYTHQPDNYYAALVCGGFDTSVFEKNKNTKVRKTYFNSASESRAIQTDESEDITRFQAFLSRTTNIPEGEVNEPNQPIAEFYGWDVNDISTWDGVSFDSEGHITEIDLPLDYEDGCLDLSGFTKLRKLEIMYSDIDSINLSGCSELKELIVSSCENIKTLNLRDCTKLEKVDISSNSLTNVEWGDGLSLKELSCSYNYLDVIDDTSFTKIVDIVEGNSGFVDYLYQYPNPEYPYAENDVAIVKEFLSAGENQNVLGWDAEDISSWTGVEWRTVSGRNYIRSIDLTSSGVIGELDVTGLTYLESLECAGNGISVINVNGLKYLQTLLCEFNKLEELILGENDSLQYVDCTYNYLDISEIQDYLEDIMRKQGISVSYKEQFINAPAEAFYEEDLRALQNLVDSQKGLSWNLDRPGDIMEITWSIVNGQYRVSGMNLSKCELNGEIDLSAFSKMRNLDLSTTEIENVILPENIERIGKNAFRSCFNLKKITIPKSVKAIETHAFYYCYGLKDIVFEGDSPEELDGGIFSRNREDIIIYYHKNANGWDSLFWERYQLRCIEDEGTFGDKEEIEGENTDDKKEDSDGKEDSGDEEEKTEEKPTIPDEKERPEDEEMPAKKEEGNTREQDKNLGAEEKNNTDISTHDENRSLTDSQKKISDSTEKGISTSVQVGKTKIVKIKQTKKKVYVTIKKVKNVSGYEISYKKGKNGKYKKLILSSKKKKAVLLNLKNKKNYYIRVRAFISKDGKKYYSAYSKVKKIKRKVPGGGKKK